MQSVLLPDSLSFSAPPRLRVLKCALVQWRSSQLLLFDRFQQRIGDRPALRDAEISYLLQRKSCCPGSALCPYAEEVSALDVLQHKGRATVFLCVNDFKVAHVNVLGVADEKAMVGHGGAEHSGFGVGIF